MVSNVSPKPDAPALTNSSAPPDVPAAAVVPLAREQVVLDKRTIPTGAVRVVVRVHQEQQQVDIPVQRDDCTVQRIPINRRVEIPPSTRQEGDTTIIPVLEEVVVIERQLILREEIRITRNRSVSTQTQHVTLRREQAHIEHVDLNDNATGNSTNTNHPQQPPEPRTGSGEQR